MRIALLSGLLCAFLIDGNVNRLNMLWLPIIYFSAVGCHTLFGKLRGWTVLPVLGAAACLLLFLGSYAETFGGEGNAAYFPGLCETIAAAEARAEEGETVYITDWVNQPYIFALFTTQTPAETFYENVEYANVSAAFRQVNRFPGFEFREPERADYLILHRTETEGRTVLCSAGRFVLCRNKR